MSAPSSLDRLLRSWKLSLAAGNKSQNTIEVYSSALEAFQTWLTENGHPTEARKIEKQDIEGFIAYLLASGRKPATAHNRYRALNTFFGWLVDEGVIKASPTQPVGNCWPVCACRVRAQRNTSQAPAIPTSSASSIHG